MSSVFPSALKRAEITPVYKKGNPLSIRKCNYRPVSVLPCLSKIFEGVIVDQLSEYFEHDLFESPGNARRYGRNDRRLVQPKCRTETYGINSFRYQGAKVWNALDQKLKNAMSTDDFRKCILQWKGFVCSCSYSNMCILNML